MSKEQREMAEGLLKRRDTVLAIAAATLISIALNVSYRVIANAEMIDRYPWLARIHEPAVSLAERVFYVLYPRIGNPWSLRCALAGGYIVLVGMWAFAAFVLLKLARLIPTLDARFRKRILLSLAISSAGYVGLAMTDTPVYNPTGMAWSVAVLAIWVLTIGFTLRCCGRRALWLLLEAPMVLLPFYSVFLVDL
jgi:hypothetical protein